jgi:hypothetical protein
MPGEDLNIVKKLSLGSIKSGCVPNFRVGIGGF